MTSSPPPATSDAFPGFSPPSPAQGAGKPGTESPDTGNRNTENRDAGGQGAAGWSFWSSLSFREGVRGAIAALIIGCVFSTVEIGWQASRERANVLSLIDEVAGQAAGSATLAAWNLDTQLADQVIRDNLKLHAVSGISITLKDGHLLAGMRRRSPTSGWLLDKLSHLVFGDQLSVRRPLYQPGLPPRNASDGPVGGEPIGELRFDLDSQALSLDLLVIAGTGLLGGIFRNMLLGLALVAVLHRYVTRPLFGLGRSIARINLDQLGQAALPVPAGHERDELGYIASRTNQLLERLRSSQEELRRLATRDPLTGLPNRALLMEELRRSLMKAERSDGRGAVFFLDIDRFKAVNESCGLAGADRLLQEIAARIMGVVRAGDTVARFGADEFALVAEDISEPADAARLAERVLQAIALPWPHDGRVIQVTACLGIALYPADGRDPDALLRAADVAMTTGKAVGQGNLRFFARDMMERVTARLTMESTLRDAIEREEFVLYFQPKLKTATRALAGVEALVRWRRGDRLIMPGDFIPVAEETGLIIPLGTLVMRAACRQAAAWLAQGHRVQVAVNVSARQLAEPGLADLVARCLAEAALPPDLLCIELTETSMMADFELSAAQLRRLRELGVDISVDDFGIGYASLSYLHRLPVTALKLDRSFVMNVPAETAIARAVIDLSRSFSLKLVAEGVETEDQARWLDSQGCEEVQGFLFARPMTAEDFVRAFLSSPSPAPSA